jgi:8-oxo-dGTP pyrophosphatase MutT (NUDIX family)
MDLNKTSNDQSIHSAVMVLHELNSDSLILTKRSEQLRNHPGEISFPGGLWEKNDLSYYDTALRELHEELGVSGDRVTLIKELTPEPTLGGIIIHPWFGTIQSITPYTLNIPEVDSIVIVPIDLVYDRNNYREITIERSGFHFTTCEFIPKYQYIWGATARIMRQLII